MWSAARRPNGLRAAWAHLGKPTTPSTPSPPLARICHSQKASSSLAIVRKGIIERIKDEPHVRSVGASRKLAGVSTFRLDDDNDDDTYRYEGHTLAAQRGRMHKWRRSIHSNQQTTTTVSRLYQSSFRIPPPALFPTIQSNQSRLLVTKTPYFDKKKDEKKPSSPTTETTKDTDSGTTTPSTTGSQPIKPMEPDFASYLSGETKSSVEQRPNKRPKRERRVGRMIALDANDQTEFYSSIQRLQTRRKEESRRKTAANVTRALWGNVIICTAKLGAWMSSGSSAMLAEFIHSVVDCGNQSLLLVGLRHSHMVADRKHPYGYGKNIYFWALVSALGTFFAGAGVSMTHAVSSLMNPSLQEINSTVWGVLCLSFVVDGYVLSKTVQETLTTRPKGLPYLQHLSNLRDPAVLAVLLEDGAACLGVVLAFGGIAASHATGNPMWDGVAGVGISALLGVMGLALVRMNHRFLLGQAVDRDITDDIEKILLSRRSVDSIGSVQSQWTGPDTFSYKAEVDFDGTYLAAKLMPIYQAEFLQIRDSMDEELQVLLALYAEDVIRTVEREVRHVEAYIRKKYPGAEYIELEPMSRDADRLAIDDNLEAELRRVESDALNRFLKTLRKEGAAKEQEDRDAMEAAINNKENDKLT